MTLADKLRELVAASAEWDTDAGEKATTALAVLAPLLAQAAIALWNCHAAELKAARPLQYHNEPLNGAEGDCVPCAALRSIEEALPE